MRKHVCVLVLSVLVALSVVASGAPRRMDVTLSIDRAETVLGLSVPLTLRIRNAGPPILLAQRARLRFTRPGGGSFIANKGVEGVEWFDIEVGPDDPDALSYDPLPIGTNQTVEVAIPAVPFGHPTWTRDTRLRDHPGVWNVEVLLYDERDSADQPLAVSSKATLSIVRPDERDMPIWDAIRRKEYAIVAEKLYREQPESSLLPYLADHLPAAHPIKKAEMLRRIVELHPNSPLVPYLRSGIVYFLRAASDRVYGETYDVERAVALANEARAEAMKLSAAPDAWSKIEGKKRLKEIPTRGYFDSLEKHRREKGFQKEPRQ